MTNENVQLPVKRTGGDTLEERLTGNAYHNILPSRYLRQDEDGNHVETQEELFERVAKNVALAEIVHAADKFDATPTATPYQVKRTHNSPDELVEEVFDTSAALNDDGELFLDEEGETVELTEENINKFSYDNLVSEIENDELREHVKEVRNEFEEMMEYLKFTPNSPTLMNAGDHLQQLSACFVMSPDDDIEDIHDTAKDAAQVFQSGGGCGYGFWRLRPYGDSVSGTGGIASGPLTFMETYDQLCQTIAQGGKRRGAQMGVMRVSHPDVIQFIHAKNKDVSLAHTLRLNDPKDHTHNSFLEALEEARELIDEEGRVPEHLRNAVEGHLSNFNISVGITEDFMEAKENGEEYTFTNPQTGEPFVANEETEELYERFGLGEYVEEGEVLSVPAQEIWERIIEGAHENGEPGVVYLDRMNDEHSFPTESTPDAEAGEYEIMATNPCFTGDTLIATDNGLKTARELYEQGTANNIVVDSRQVEDSETVKEASSVYKTGEKDVFELSTKEGYSIRLTADHKVMTENGWKEVSELESGEEVHILDHAGEFGNHGSKELGYVLGWLVGDGHLNPSNGTAVLNMYGDDTSISETLTSAVNSIVRDPVTDREYTVNPHSAGTTQNGVVEQRIESERLLEVADEFELTSQKVQVPDEVLHGNKEMATGFLSALFTADGTVVHNEDKGYRYVGLTSSNEDLVEDVQTLLLNFGIKSTLYKERRNEGMRHLPDGNGGTAEYETAAQHELRITSESLQIFEEEIGFMRDDKQDALSQLVESYDRGPYSQNATATIETVEKDGVEAVFDLTEPNTHSLVADGFVIHNCGEQELMEYEACNLGHINLSTLIDEDAPDWRNFDVDADGLEAEVEAFLEQAIDWDEFDYRIKYGTRFLENVVTMSEFPIDKITETVRDNRKIGLGVMGLAQMYVQLGIRYGDDIANEVARQVMMHINHESKQVGHELAEERGVFRNWEDSKYADPTEYREWFEHHTGLDADEWEDGFRIRNHNTTVIAPTGTTSMVANTTGGCEPMYNVAYMKNVAQDVQGEEMLVEFDDYFLRTLEANDIDVDAAKKEAYELMQENEFDGLESLETVPNEIGELFITTGDLTAKEHAAVQCACQDGVDAAISKTVNAPNDATLEDAKEAFEYIYEHGGKGVTYYRDGTRNKQVLTTRADNKEFSDMDEEELAEQVANLAEDDDDVREQIAEELGLDGQKYRETRDRPTQLTGATQRIDTGYGKMYVTVNTDEDGDPFELFANIGHSGGYTNGFVEALAKVTSIALRSGVDPDEIIEELEGTRSPKMGWDNGDQIHSIPDAIGKALERVQNGNATEVQQNLDEVAQTAQAAAETTEEEQEKASSDDATAQLLADGESPECPDCGSMTLYYSEGCKTCESCGWSEC